jgi:N6-L-threonylcarbamoyladenine synthase
MKDSSLDFSFSGLKTAALRWIEETKMSRSHARLGDFLASFEEAVARAVLVNVAQATEKFKPASLILCGGVARNKRLRRHFEELARANQLLAFIPAPQFCTDNAAMVAALAIEKLKTRKKPGSPLVLDAYPRFIVSRG